MSEILNVFACKESKQYFVDDNGVIWLHGHLTCERLGFKNPSRDIQLHTEVDERQKVPLGGLEDVWFVNEYGVWGMILAAKTSEAKEFKRYLKYDVLPSIRKKGGYISPTASSDQLEALKGEIDTLQASLNQAVLERNRAESGMALAAAKYQDISGDLSLMHSEALPQFVAIVKSLKTEISFLESAIRNDASDIYQDVKNKRYKSLKDVDSMALMSTKESVKSLTRLIEKLTPSLFQSVENTVKRLASNVKESGVKLD